MGVLSIVRRLVERLFLLGIGLGWAGSVALQMGGCMKVYENLSERTNVIQEVASYKCSRKNRVKAMVT
jgi:hypothetical protein